MKDKTTAPAGVVSGNDLGCALDAARSALPEFSQQDDYPLAHGASLMSEDSHEILHRDTLRRIVAAAVAAERKRCAQFAKDWLTRGRSPLGMSLAAAMLEQPNVRVQPDPQAKENER